MSVLVKVELIMLVLGVYWLPSIVARIRRHPDLVPIVVVNALLGWTLVGWVWAILRIVSGRASHRLQLEAACGASVGAKRATIRER